MPLPGGSSLLHKARGPHGCLQHPTPPLQHQRLGRIFLWVCCRHRAVLGSTAHRCLSDLMKSAFGFQHSFGSGMKIVGLHTTSSELVKKKKIGNWGKISHYLTSCPDECNASGMAISPKPWILAGTSVPASGMSCSFHLLGVSRGLSSPASTLGTMSCCVREAQR